MGLYQCRGDLSASECSKCVSTIPSLANQLCGESEEALIKLGGCYLHYQFTTELAEKSVNATKFVEKICKDKQATDEGFWEKMESAFNRVMTGTGIGGFYTGCYEDVNVSDFQGSAKVTYQTSIVRLVSKVLFRRPRLGVEIPFPARYI